jgi:hypothetical protein
MQEVTNNTSSSCEQYHIDYQESDMLSSIDGFYVVHGSFCVVTVNKCLPPALKQQVRQCLVEQLERSDRSPIGVWRCE